MHCSGCGVPLQFQNDQKPGYAYQSKPQSNAARERYLTRQHANGVFEDVLQDVDETILAKLNNTTPVLKEAEEERQVQLRREEEDLEKLDEDEGAGFDPNTIDAVDDASRDDLNKTYIKLPHKPKPIKYHKPLCLRCHEITYHSNPLNHTLSTLPIAQTISNILTSITTTNTDPDNPPVLVHVLDVADFPLSFIPFEVPRRGKVLFAINRADVLCPRASAMARLRPWFKTEVGKVVAEKGMEGWDGEVYPMSARKGWGIKEFIARIFQLRNRESNVYFIGTSPLFFPPTGSLSLSIFVWVVAEVEVIQMLENPR
jgi:hypothetical protein